MELSENISALQSSAESQLPALNSLKKTETALILPFFDVLDYDSFDVREVEPDFNVELGDQGMRTVDYALKRDGSPLMLVQCAEAKTDLETSDSRFLLEHFDELEADVAVFTNGLSYQFYANLKAEINVYERPFLEFDLLEHGPEQIEGLKRLAKSAFNAEEILSAVYDRKCGRLLQDYLVQQQTSPDEHFVRFMAAQIHEGDVSEHVVERFGPVVEEVLGELVDGESEGQEPIPSREDVSHSPKPEEDIELTASEEEPVANGEDGEEDEGDPFEKDLARRVIEEF